MQQGFTLNELMIVIAIIGILASISLPAYQDYIARAQVSEALSLASGLKAAVVEHYSATGICPYNFAGRPADMTTGIAAASQISGKYVAQVQTGQANTFDRTPLISVGSRQVLAVCVIVPQMKSTGIAKAIQDKKLYLYMAPTSGSFAWKCEGGGNKSSIPDRYLPSSCQ